MKTNTKAVLAWDRLRDHWGTGAFWTLAMIIHVQHLQICFKSASTVEKRQVLVCHTKSMEKIMLNQHFLMLISDLCGFNPVSIHFWSRSWSQSTNGCGLSQIRIGGRLHTRRTGPKAD